MLVKLVFEIEVLVIVGNASKSGVRDRTDSNSGASDSCKSL